MGPKPKRYQYQCCLHFITFSCHRRMPLLYSVTAREIFEQELERVRRWYGCYVTGYVVMPEHVHLLISEPERNTLSVVIQMLKQITSHKLKLEGSARFWRTRYYDFPVWSEGERVEKLRYIHRNPLKRGLVARPEQRRWSSFLQWSTGCEGSVEIECPSQRARQGWGDLCERIFDCPSQAKGGLSGPRERDGLAA
jgi:putative transposase